MRLAKVLLVAMLAVFVVAGTCDNNDPTPEPEDKIKTGTITENTTWGADDTVILRGGVFVGDGVNETVLTIEAGATIYGESSTKGMLVVARGSKLIAQGTATDPIVMTSDKAAGQRGRSDWGGLILNGNGILNTGDEAYGEGGTGYYGGTDNTDNSGTLSYVRVEYAGREISPDNELNGIAFQGCGSGTMVDHVQVHMNKDDGIEFYGGAANIKYAYLTGIGDDCFDITDGWVGKAQFIVAQQYPDDSDQGFECDNSGDDNTATPYTNPTIYGFTMCGVPTSEHSDEGMLLREGLKGKWYNGIVCGFNSSGLDIDHDQTWANAAAGELIVDNCIFMNDKNFKEDDDTLSGNWVRTFAMTTMTNNLEATNSPVVDPYNLTTPDYTPQNDALTHTPATPPDDGFFTTPTNFIGGVDPNDKWYEGWTTSAQN